jgi:redox-sensitive bicupin YhaK (pirin superfamily)
MGFRSLRVINEDRVKGGAGFGTHPHDNMEIVTYVLEGALQHRDSTGNTGVIRPGDVQAMSAGSGLTHSEFNASKSEPVHLLQIWIVPEKRNSAPKYDQKHFDEPELRGKLRMVVSPDGKDGSLRIGQDASIFAARFDGGEAVTHPLEKGRAAWVQVARGALRVNGATLQAGDGAAIEEESAVTLSASEPGEVLVFDLA